MKDWDWRVFWWCFFAPILFSSVEFFIGCLVTGFDIAKVIEAFP